MAETMKLQVITPDKEFFHGDVSMVELNTADGELGVYPQHIPLTTAVAPGILKIHQDGQVKKAALLSGFLQILPEKMTILAEVCEWPEEIDGARANEARIRAERRLTEHSPETDIARAEAALQRALVRLSLVEEH
ncbi:MAG: ATP synthase F1 subunit epsilon [Enterocloster sp.]